MYFNNLCSTSLVLIFTSQLIKKKKTNSEENKVKYFLMKPIGSATWNEDYNNEDDQKIITSFSPLTKTHLSMNARINQERRFTGSFSPHFISIAAALCAWFMFPCSFPSMAVLKYPSARRVFRLVLAKLIYNTIFCHSGSILLFLCIRPLKIFSLLFKCGQLRCDGKWRVFPILPRVLTFLLPTWYL